MKIGIVGAGFARRGYLPAIGHLHGVEVVAITAASRSSAESAAGEFGILNAYDDWRTMLDRHLLDAVLIASPPETHAPIAIEALAAGCHVFCEKPTALDADEARAMLEKAMMSDRVHMINHELRFDGNRRKVKALIDEGRLGPVRSVSITSTGTGWWDPASRVEGDWWSSSAKGGGQLGAMGSHLIDLIRWWLGPVASVVGEAQTFASRRRDLVSGAEWIADADDFVHFAMRMSSGASVQVTATSVAAHPVEDRTVIIGESGTIVLHHATERLLWARAREEFIDITVEPAAEAPGSRIWERALVPALEAFRAAAVEGRTSTCAATFVDGLRNQEVIDAIRRSSFSRKWVDVPAHW